MRLAWRLVLGVFGVVLLLWFVETRAPASETASLARAATGLSAVAVIDGSDAEPVPPAAPTAPSAHPVDEIELCGGMWVKTTPDGSVDDDDLRRVTRLEEVRAQLMAELRADPTEYAQAVSMWLGMIGDDAARAAAVSAGAGCATAECETLRRGAAGYAAARDALARLAVVSRDPRVYVLALNSCGRTGAGEGACRLLSAEQWAQLDPDNAAPWIAVLERAVQQRDAAEQTEALHRIAVSRRSDQRFGAVAAYLIDRLPNDEASMPATLALAGEVIGVEAAWSMAGYQQVAVQCNDMTLRDVNRREVCSAVAELLAERSDTLIERGIGTLIGQRVGWSDERVDRMRGEVTAYQGAEVAPPEGPAQACAGVRREVDRMKRIGQRGETSVLRDWIAGSGKRPEEFIRTQRAFRAGVAASAASAQASAAFASR